MGARWNFADVWKLKEIYRTASPEELEQVLGRPFRSISQKLYLLQRKENSLDQSRVNYLYRLAIYQYRGKTLVHTVRKWTVQDIAILQKHYQDQNLPQLAQILNRSESGVINKLKQLSLENQVWDKQRVKVLSNSWHRQYFQRYAKTHPQKIQYWRTTVTLREKYIARERQWQEEDTILLANTYFTHSWEGLVRIFKYKLIDPLDKLYELYKQTAEREWDGEQLELLARQRDTYSLEEQKALQESFVPPGWKRNQTIDSLIMQGFSQSDIARQLQKSRDAIYQYIHTRGLGQWYKEQQGQHSTE